jgi:sulfotransferase family protein
MTVAHEANALKLVIEENLSRRDLFETLVENARSQADHPRGRHASGGYSFVVPNQWQGRTRRLRVIGDKMGGRTRARLERDPTELTSLARLVRAPVHLLHVTRNPYDCIARRVLIAKDGLPVQDAIHNFAQSVRTIADILIAEGDARLLTVRHESLVHSPRTELARACHFLGVEPDDAYLDDCASIVFSAPQTARHRIEWTPEDRDAVQEIIDRHAFLVDYSWTSST